MGETDCRRHALQLMSDPIEKKLSAARTKLILDRPFLGALVLRLELVDATDWCRTTATDAKSFFYNREFIEALSIEHTQFMLAHDALHCALLHFSRRQSRDRHRWDVACDFAVNPLLINDGLDPAPGALFLHEFDGLTAEEIYPLIDDSNDESPLDEHVYEQESEDDKENLPKENQQQNKPSPLTEKEKEELSVQWQQRLAGAAQSAKQAGKLDGAMARMVDHLLQPQLPWRMLLSRYMTAMAKDDYSYVRPSSRRDDSSAIYPSLRSNQINLMVIIDTSGSIHNAELAEFLSEIDSLKGQMRASVTVHACDEKMDDNGPWVFEAWQEMKLPEDLKGGGGTNFCPAFDWVSSLDQPPDLLVYFSDAKGRFPKQQPSYPVIWLVKGKIDVPWGQRVQLN